MCDCGKEKVVVREQLVGGITKSCGCLAKKFADRNNLVGRRFFRLVVLNRSERTDIKAWDCICDCGGTKRGIKTSDLLCGKTKSCGCYKGKANQKGLGESAKNSVYGRYRLTASKKHQSFTITMKDFEQITKLPCAYCGKDPSNLSSTPGNNGTYTYSGIDRVDNNSGYDLDNIVPCCFTCNRMKTNLSKSGFLNQIEKIYTFSQLERRKNGI